MESIDFVFFLQSFDKFLPVDPFFCSWIVCLESVTDWAFCVCLIRELGLECVLNEDTYFLMFFIIKLSLESNFVDIASLSCCLYELSILTWVRFLLIIHNESESLR
jgi:hypothetical protein